jgi:predicted nucleic acid-binding protein
MTLVFDSTPLSHFARAGVLDVLEAISADHRRITTEAVSDELKAGVAEHPELAAIQELNWLEIVSSSSLEELRAFSEYARRLGSGPRNVGEASVLAWAEVNNAIAIVDERAGTNHGRERRVRVHGTLWLICEGYRKGLLGEAAAEGLVVSL